MFEPVDDYSIKARGMKVFNTLEKKLKENKPSMKAKKKLTPLPKLLKKAEKVFNAYVRQRDQGLQCISCQNPGNQAGHYFPVKGFSALRFHEWNINLQCAGCNCYSYGNQAMYRIGLVKRIGEKAVKELEEIAVNNRVKKWSRVELEEIIKKYSLN